MVVDEPLPEHTPDQELNGLFHKVKKAKVVNYGSLPPTQQKDFDVTFSFIEDLDKRKLISGIWSKVLDNMGWLGALLRTFSVKIAGMFGGKHDHNNNQPANTQQQTIAERTLDPGTQKLKIALSDGMIDGKDKAALSGVDIEGGLAQLARSYVQSGGKQDLDSRGQLATLGNKLAVDINNPSVSDANPSDYRTDTALKPVIEAIAR